MEEKRLGFSSASKRSSAARARVRVGAVNWIPLIAAGIQAMSTRNRNREEEQEARRSREFQLNMSNTASQRQVADLEQAGINPMLSARLGGASTGGGQMASVSDVGSAAISSAGQAASILGAFQQMRQSEAQSQQLEASTKEIQSRTFEHNLNTAEKVANIANVKMDTLGKEEIAGLNRTINRVRQIELARDKETFSADVARRKAESEISQFGVPAAKAGAEFYGSDLGSANPYIRQILEVLRGVTSATRR